MQPQPNPQLIDQIKQFQAKGVSDDKLTTALMNAGWSDSEIQAALFEVNNQPSSFADANQAAAIAISNAGAENQYDKLRQDTVLDGLAGSVGPSQLRGYYQAKFYDDIGIGWWSTHAIDFAAAAIAIHFHAPWVYTIVSLAILGHIGYSTYKVIWWRRHRQRINQK